MALDSPPGPCPPSGRGKAAPLRTQDPLKGFVSRRLDHSPGMMRLRHRNGLPGGVMLTQGERHLRTHPRHWGEAKGPRPHACRPAGISPTSPTSLWDQTLRTPPPRGLRGASTAATAVRWAETLAMQGASFSILAAARMGCGWLGEHRAPLNVLIWRQPRRTCAVAGKTDHPRPELSRSIFKLSPCFMGCTRTDAQATRGHLSMF